MIDRPADTPDLATMAEWLDGGFPGGDSRLAEAARDVMMEEVGPAVHLRGLLEFSNECRCDCYYCGIRLSNGSEKSFRLTEDEIVDVALHCRDAGFGSMTLQSGERRDSKFIAFVERVIRRIKVETATPDLPRGLGITLCVGEQSRETFQRFYEAGAHRYLLRIESSDPDLFACLHPPGQPYDRRVRALLDLKEIGYQLGTGVMIGIPGQDAHALARDVRFFRDIDADMIGMGPYIEADGTAAVEMRRRRLLPSGTIRERLRRSLRMIGVTRIALRDVNIAATTALQALSPTGREAGLAFGANVMMPIVTPAGQRAAYQLYDGKPCIDEGADACTTCTARRAAFIGRPVSRNLWGDAPHAAGRSGFQGSEVAV